LDGIFEQIALSVDGSRLAGFTDSNTVGVWEVPTGKKLAVLAAPGDETGFVRFAADGRLVVGQFKARSARPVDAATDQLSRDSMDITIWSCDFRSRQAKFQIFTDQRDFGWFGLPFFANGQIVYLPGIGGRWSVWDFSVNPPRCINSDLEQDEHTDVFINNSGRRVVTDDQNEIRLYQWPSKTSIALEDAVTDRWNGFSPSGRWFAARKNHSVPDSPWKRWLQSHLPLSWTGNLNQANQIRIWDAETGRICNRVRGEGVKAWTADESAVWVEMDRPSNSAYQMVFALWPTIAPRPPWWLYLLTAAGLAVIIADVRRMLRRRARPAAA